METNLRLSQLYSYLKSCLGSSGELIDPLLKSPLDFQYHYSAFLIAALYYEDRESFDKVFSYFSSLSLDKLSVSYDFHNFFLLNLLFWEKRGKWHLGQERREKISNFIKKFPLSKYLKLNNNFRALRLANLVMENFLFPEKKEKEITKEIKWLLNLQFSDGFFPDSPSYDNPVDSVPHLVYHAKITMCTGITAFFLQEESVIKSFLSAQESLLKVSQFPFYFFYGRSTNSLFGYASFYLNLILMKIFTDDDYYLNLSQKLLNFLFSYQQSDGHLCINLNLHEYLRPGYDGYMYQIVYNAYFLSLVLLGELWKKESFKGRKIGYRKGKEQRVFLFFEAGFLIFKGERGKYALNFKGHQSNPKHLWDSRVSPFSLLYFCDEKENNWLPGPFFPDKPLFSLVERDNKLLKLKYFYWKIFYDKWLPLFNGNIFAFQKGGKLFYPWKLVKKVYLADKFLLLKFEARERVPFFKKKLGIKAGEEKEYFVVSFTFSSTIKMKILFYQEVEKLYFTYRILDGNNRLNYVFSEKIFKKLKDLKKETSYCKACLKRFVFGRLKKLEVLIEEVRDNEKN